jgi:hypothetical protein
MSGGSFDYLCYAVEIGTLGERRGAIEAMAQALDEYDQPAAAKAADRTRAVLAALDAADELARQLSDVWHAVEWHHSSDWGEEDVLEVLQKHWGGDADE